MFQPIDSNRKWSRIGLRAAIVSIGLTVLFSVMDGVLRGPLLTVSGHSDGIIMLYTWCTDFRYLSEQLVYASVILFAAAKIFEGRTFLSVGFDTLDKDKIRLDGPDEDNVVWIGQQYGTRLEAESIAVALQSRFEESRVG